MRLTRNVQFAAALAIAVAVISNPNPAGAAGFADLDAEVPDDLVDEDEIYQKYLELLGADAAKITEIQNECPGIGAATGTIGPRTDECLKKHAKAFARGRARGADAETTLRGELDTCNESLEDCRGGRAGTATTVGGLKKINFVPTARARAFAVQRCAPGSQVRWISPTRFECNANPTFDISIDATKCELAPDGQTIVCDEPVVKAPGLDFGLEDPTPGGYGPRPRPAESHWCNSGAGPIVCYVLPIAAAIGGGFAIAGAAGAFDRGTVTILE